MRTNLISLITLFLLFSCGASKVEAPNNGQSAPPENPNELRSSFQINGTRRNITFFIPDSLDTKKRILLLALHGGGGDAKGMANVSGFNQLAQKHGFMVGYPQGFDKRWSDGRTTSARGIDDISFFQEIIDMVKKNKIAKKVYIVGISNGGLMAQRIACELSASIDGVATVAATMAKNTLESCFPSHSIPVLRIHGNKDKFIPFQGGEMPFGMKGKVASHQELDNLWSRVNNCNGDWKITRISNRNNDGTTSQVKSKSCEKKVEMIEIKNGGHTWPGSSVKQPVLLLGLTSFDFKASEKIWEFFSK